MESQQDIVDLTINDDDDCFFLTEPPNKTATAKKNHESVNACKSEDGESVYGSEDSEITAKQNQEDDILSVYGSEDSEITAKQTQEDDTLSCYGSEDGEIVSKEEEKEEDSKKIFSREFGQISEKSKEKQCPNLLHSMFTRAVIKLSIQGKWKGSVWDSK